MYRVRGSQLQTIGNPFAGFDDSADTDEAWLQIRNAVQHQLARNDYISVPFISQASFYTLWSIFIKRHKYKALVKSSAVRPVPCYMPIGPISRYTLSQREQVEAKLDAKWKYLVQPFYRYVLHLSQERQIELVAKKVYESFTPFIAPYEVQLNTKLLAQVRRVRGDSGEKPPPNSVWVVHSVLWCKKLLLRIRTGGKDKVRELHNQIIGFKLTKYKNITDGWLPFPSVYLDGNNLNGWFLHPGKICWPTKEILTLQEEEQEEKDVLGHIKRARRQPGDEPILLARIADVQRPQRQRYTQTRATSETNGGAYVTPEEILQSASNRKQPVYYQAQVMTPNQDRIEQDFAWQQDESHQYSTVIESDYTI